MLYRRTLSGPGKRKETLMKARKTYFAENVNYQITEEKYRGDKTRRSKRFETTQSALDIHQDRTRGREFGHTCRWKDKGASCLQS